MMVIVIIMTYWWQIGDCDDGNDSCNGTVMMQVIVTSYGDDGDHDSNGTHDNSGTEVVIVRILVMMFVVMI